LDRSKKLKKQRGQRKKYKINYKTPNCSRLITRGLLNFHAVTFFLYLSLLTAGVLVILCVVVSQHIFQLAQYHRR
jgi:hypothetical protein